MEIGHLKYFYSVAKEGSFTRASRALRIQQPTMSKMVKSLEESLGGSLLERHRSGVVLTPMGVRVYAYCEEIFDRVREIEALAHEEDSECSGPLAFGATDSVASYLVPQILGGFVRRWPKVRPSLFAGSSNLICEEILEGKIEFGIFFTVPATKGFQITDLAQVPFNLVMAPSAPREVRNSFILSREIDYPKSRPFPVLEMLRKNRVTGETAISSNNLDSQKELVKQGLGISLLPRFMVRSSFASGSLTIAHAKKDFFYSMKLATRRGKPLSRNAEAFLEVFRAQIDQLI
jgi:DNA-binding transcriptional LysR family regulator